MMKRALKHCAAQILILVFYITGMAYRTGTNGSNMVNDLRLWAEK